MAGSRDDNANGPKGGGDGDGDGGSGAALQRKPAGRKARPAALFRVVEVGHAPNGRLVRQGQVWHSDLAVARRFGRALAANSVGQQVVVADSAGAVLESIALAPPGAAAAGWGGWREMPLPPLPPAVPTGQPRPAASRALPAAPAPGSAPPPAPAARSAPRDVPVVQSEMGADDAADIALPDA